MPKATPLGADPFLPVIDLICSFPGRLWSPRTRGLVHIWMESRLHGYLCVRVRKKIGNCMDPEETDDFVSDFMVDHFWLHYAEGKGLVWNWDPDKRSRYPGGIAGVPGTYVYLCGFLRYFVTALLREAVRNCIAKKQAEKRRQEPEILEEEAVDPPEISVDVIESDTLWKEVAEMCVQLIARAGRPRPPELGEGERKMLRLAMACLECPILAGARDVLLRRGRGERPADIAVELGTTAENVRTQWSRGLRRLASCLRSRWSGGPPAHPGCSPAGPPAHAGCSPGGTKS